MIQVTDRRIRTEEIYEQLSRNGAGSVVVHFGIVKPVVDDRRTKGIRLAPDGDLEAELKNIERQLRGKWDIVDVVLIRRIGELLIGETILVAAVSATSKDAAFGACEEAIETLKKKRALRKEELYET
jgi:molybdopterin synthase catalytic subunit